MRSLDGPRLFYWLPPGNASQIPIPGHQFNGIINVSVRPCEILFDLLYLATVNHI